MALGCSPEKFQIQFSTERLKVNGLEKVTNKM